MKRYRVKFYAHDAMIQVSILLDAKSRRGAFRQFFDGLGVRWGTKVSLGAWDIILNQPFTLSATKL